MKCLCKAQMEYLGRAYYLAIWECSECKRLAVLKDGRIFWYVREDLIDYKWREEEG